MKANKANIDFTRGSIIHSLVLFALPILLGELLQNLYNSVDSMVVGNFVSKNALAAVSVCATLSRLIVGFFTGMSVGGSVVTARAFGSGDKERLSRTIRTILVFSIVLGAVLSVLGVIVAPLLLKLSSVPEDVYPDALTYLRIYLAGALFSVIYNIGAGVLRAVGDTQRPFHILLISCCSNIVLDLLLVVVIPLGVAGVAIATVLAQLISVVLLYRTILRIEPGFHLSLRDLKENRSIILDLTAIGMPAGMQGAVISISNLFVWRYINGFGSTAMAGIGVAQRLDRFVGMPCTAFGHAMTTFVGQNIGAKQYQRAKQGTWKCLLLAVGYIAVMGTIVYNLADYCAVLFNPDPQVVEISVAMMHFIIPYYTFFAVREVYLGVLRGYGIGTVPMVLNIIGMVLVRQIYLAVSMQSGPGIVHIFRCYPIAWGATALLLVGYYFYYLKAHLAKKTDEDSVERAG